MRRVRVRLTDPLMTTVITVYVLVCLGLGLLLQADRWSSTPAYGTLLALLTAPGWGFVYLGLGLLVWLVAAVDRLRFLSFWAHAPVFFLLVFWLVAFIVRWKTDPHTTVANVLAWSVYVFTAVRSAVAIAERHAQKAIPATVDGITT
jgi:hypothetical protein